MRQRITVMQLRELTAPQYIKLKSLWKPKSYDLFIDEDETMGIAYGGVRYYPTIPDGDCLPILTIGQCIELLYEYDCDMEITSEWMKWHVGNEESTYLIDALWKAVKYIL